MTDYSTIEQHHTYETYKNIPTDLQMIEIAKRRTSPKCDFWFKKIFGEHKNICKDFIESITGLRIKSLEYGNTESLGDIYATKKICFDVNVILDNGMRTNIEMQVEDDKENPDRFGMYACRYHGAQLKAGEEYTKVTKTIIIHIFDYNFLDKEPFIEPINQYQILHTLFHTPLTEKLDIYIIELPKIPKIWHNESEKWLAWLNDREDALRKGVTMQNQQIANAEEIFNTLKNDPIEQMNYVSVLKFADREKAKLQAAKAEGERETALKIAREMKIAGMSYDMIQKFTHLTTEDIEKA